MPAPRLRERRLLDITELQYVILARGRRLWAWGFSAAPNGLRGTPRPWPSWRPRRASTEALAAREDVAGDDGQADVAVNVLAVAPLAVGLALAVTDSLAPGPDGTVGGLASRPGGSPSREPPGRGGCG